MAKIEMSFSRFVRLFSKVIRDQAFDIQKNRKLKEKHGEEVLQAMNKVIEPLQVILRMPTTQEREDTNQMKAKFPIYRYKVIIFKRWGADFPEVEFQEMNDKDIEKYTKLGE